jgi:hypothetical protein
MTDLVDRMIQWEAGELDEAGTDQLFQQLVHDGTVWQLQGAYGRTAAALIQAGRIQLNPFS